MSYGKAKSKSIFTRTGTPKTAKGWAPSASAKKSYSKSWNDAFYGIDRGLDKLLPELYTVKADGVRSFDLMKYFYIAQPAVEDYNVDIMNICRDYLGAGFLYPWTALQFGARNCKWFTKNNYHQLNTMFSVTADNFRMLLDDHSLIFPHTIREAVQELIDPNANIATQALWAQMQAHHAAGRPPPGGSGLASAWPESIILHALMRGIGRDRFLAEVQADIAQACQDGLNEGLSSAEIVARTTAGKQRAERNKRIARATLLRNAARRSMAGYVPKPAQAEPMQDGSVPMSNDRKRMATDIDDEALPRKGGARE